MTTVANQKTNSSTGEEASNSKGALQLVSFQIGDEEYVIEITKIQEIILTNGITRVPQMPDHVKGVINLRGHVIPILSMQEQFGLDDSKPTENARIIVINACGETIGLIVDAVNEVLRVSEEMLSPPPSTVAALGTNYLTGLVKLNSRLLIMLNIEMLFGESKITRGFDVATSN